MGTSAAESLTIEVLNGSGNKTAEQINFTTATASGTADHGKMVFAVDETTIATIDDGGIDLASGKEFSVNGTAIGSTGLTLVTSGSVSAATGITLDNVFTSTYKNYLFQFNGEGTTNNIEQLRVRFRASSSTNTDSDYSYAALLVYFETGSGSADGFETGLDQSFFQVTGNWLDDEKFSGQITFQEPQVSGQSTSIQYQFGNKYNQGADSYATHNGTGIKEGTGSFDGFYFYADGSQTITGNYRLYGYN
jgi:hypothetical protein